MKLQKVLAYRYGDKSQYKYVVTIPEEIITDLGWESGSELNACKGKNRIVIDFVAKPSKVPKKVSEPKMPYEEFRDKIKKALEYNDEGMTWTELRNKLGLDQVVPNNKWVRQMENDIGLKRFREVRGIVWRIIHV
jgi:hypothetical protein